jgi:hypothetical protein
VDHYQLAQVNVGRLIAPIDDPKIADFVAQLDAINLLAEQSPGFIWRLKSESGNATDIAYSSDPLMIVNMSVWQSVDALKAFTYQSHHVEVLRQRKSWFEKMATPHTCLWWIPAGHFPTVAEARDRLEHFTAHGATAHAFSFTESFPSKKQT